MNYESRIDPTDFATVTRYLRLPNSPIHFVLHVRERALLAPLATELDATMHRPGATGRDVLAVVQRHVRERTLLVSPRPSAKPVDGPGTIDLTTIPQYSVCQVIWLPPFYLAHTPGLFESTLVLPIVAPGHDQVKNQSPGARIKP